MILRARRLPTRLLARALFIVNPEPSMSFTTRRVEPEYPDPGMFDHVRVYGHPES